MKQEFLSRKFILQIVTSVLMVLAPIYYKKIGVADNVTMMVLGLIASVYGVYAAANVTSNKKQVQKKV